MEECPVNVLLARTIPYDIVNKQAYADNNTIVHFTIAVSAICLFIWTAQDLIVTLSIFLVYDIK